MQSHNYSTSSLNVEEHHTPYGAYSSQSQGGVERAHRTLFAQVRTLKAQIRQNYNSEIPMEHPRALDSLTAHTSGTGMRFTTMDAQAASVDATHTTLRVWRDSAVHASNSETTKGTDTGQATPSQHRHIHRYQLGITRDNKKERNRISSKQQFSYESRTQATIALSSAESELHAVVQQHRRASTSATSSRKHLEYAPT